MQISVTKESQIHTSVRFVDLKEHEFFSHPDHDECLYFKISHYEAIRVCRDGFIRVTMTPYSLVHRVAKMNIQFSVEP